SPYAMFCDQDDVWLSDKVERSLEEMQRLEALHGFSTPLLVHTDLRVVDSDLEEIGPSFWKVAKLNPQTRGDLRHFLVQNCAVGCTFFFNRALTERTGEIPDRGVIMHDWWRALVAAAYGKISALNEPRILYRRHPQTVTSTTQKRQKIKNMIQRREDNFPYIAQARAFYYTFRKSLSAENLQLVEVTATLLKQSIWRRKWRIIRYRLERQTTLRSLVFLVMI
ncbi:MAG: hypothetical protein KDK40_02900, partial [Chlamydiia bacterium]|nr:hypothetical protein [Chlamydiia bacterium]